MALDRLKDSTLAKNALKAPAFNDKCSAAAHPGATVNSPGTTGSILDTDRVSLGHLNEVSSMGECIQQKRKGGGERKRGKCHSPEKIHRISSCDREKSPGLAIERPLMVITQRLQISSTIP